MIYRIGKDIFEIEYLNGQFSYSIFLDKKTLITNDFHQFQLPTFFYTVVINYSHHSFNSESVGNWITQLFHKNDAYATPLVINPMRTRGNFDINHEIKLSKERLLSNIVFNLINNKDYRLLNKYKIVNFVFKPKKYTRYVFSPGEEFSNSTLLNLIKKKTGIDRVDEAPFYWEIAFGYLDYKINRISKNYASVIYKDNENPDELLVFLLNDKTHISKKVRQTLNFLSSTNNKNNYEFWKHPEGNVTVTLSNEKMLEWLQTFGHSLPKMTPAQLVEFALPGFFSIDFDLTDNFGQPTKFENLSSGEQQMILNENSILYHLYNLQSIHNNSSQNIQRDRPKYDNINIVFDEIELYYHPDMQRRLVKAILDNLGKVKTREEAGIKAINICFLTHSPFILSDILQQNVLRLSENTDESIEPTIETFGSNIYDLLNDAFFMRDGFIGDFAMKIINEIIGYVDDKVYNATDQKRYISLSELIGDEIIRDKLNEMLSQKEIESHQK